MPDLHTTYAYAVEIDGVTFASFKEASALAATTEVIDCKESSAAGSLLWRKVPGSPGGADVTLRRRIDDAVQLWEWRQQVLEGDIDSARRTGSIVLDDSLQNEIARWNFDGAWPAVWKGADYDAGANEVMV